MLQTSHPNRQRLRQEGRSLPLRTCLSRWRKPCRVQAEWKTTAWDQSIQKAQQRLITMHSAVVLLPHALHKTCLDVRRVRTSFQTLKVSKEGDLLIGRYRRVVRRTVTLLPINVPDWLVSRAEKVVTY